MKVFEVMPLAHVPFSESWFKADKADVICRELHERIRKGEVKAGDLFYIYEYSTFEWQDEKGEWHWEKNQCTDWRFCELRENGCLAEV